MTDFAAMTDQMRVEEEVTATVKMLVAGVAPDAVEPISRGDVYDVQRGTATAYMIGGGGPTSYAVVVPDPMGGVLVLVTVHGWSERAHRVLSGPDAAKVASALHRAARGAATT